MILLTSVITVLVSFLVEASATNAPGVTFIGTGYNILKANPDEGDQTRGGIDPGILTTRRIFEISWDEQRPSSDQRHTVPDEVNYQSRSSCVNTTINDMITDAKSLQENLKMGIGFSIGGGIPFLSNFAFAANPSYKKEVKEDSKEGKVFMKSTKICNVGQARYRQELAAVKKFNLSEGFMHVACKLPNVYDEDAYMKFIENWGTHVIVEVDVGVKNVKKVENSIGEMFSFASKHMSTGAVKAGGTYQGASGSLEFNVENFKKSESSKTWNKGKTTEYVVGTIDQPEPIRLVLEEINHALQDDFWHTKQSCSKEDRKTKMGNIKKALSDYPKWMHADAPKTNALVIPLTWPKGTYALAQADEKCPVGKGFDWDTGSRIQISGSGFRTTPDRIHWPTGSAEQIRVKFMKRYKVEQSFCLKSKEKATSYEMEWPQGRYCIIKLGDCPAREFQKGSITWDDRSDKVQNRGSLPDGDFSTKGLTKVEFCCRNDGIASSAIFLPTDRSFYLFRYGGQCQKVNGMEFTDEEIHWDEPNFAADSSSEGAYPDNSSENNIELHYCYYMKSKR